jgi:Ca2+/Na+ antiporter
MHDRSIRNGPRPTAPPQVWLAVLADVMMMAAEHVACLLGVPEDLMGLTVTAAGTSLPNLFGSMIVAKQGLGNMAVSNAFGAPQHELHNEVLASWGVAARHS